MNMRHFGGLVGGTGSILCLIGTISAMSAMLHSESPIHYLWAFGLPIIFIGVLLFTASIFRSRSNLHSLLKSAWLISGTAVVSLLFAFSRQLFLKQALNDPDLTVRLSMTMLACVMVLFLASAPILLSYTLLSHGELDRPDFRR